MKGEHRPILFAAVAAAAFWVLDALLGCFIFEPGAGFSELLVTRVSPHDIYYRSLVAILLLTHGVASSFIFRRRRAVEEQLRAANEQFEAANEQLAAGEQALRAERDRAQRYLDVAAVMILVLDADGRVELINSKGCKILEVDESGILGRKWVDNFIPEMQRAEISARLASILAGNVSSFVFAENNVLTARGSERTIAWHNAVLRNKDGSVSGVISSGADITEQKEAEAREERLAEQLARAQRMESLGVLAGGVAHDLNNILGSIVTVPDMMLDDLNDLPDDIDLSQLREDITTVRETGKTAAQVIRDLLTLSRRGHYQMDPMILNNVVEAYMATPLFKQLKSENPSLLVKTELGPDLLPIAGSESHLMQVLMNLVSNAVEAMPHGGEITIRTANRYVKRHAIRYEVIEEGEYVVLSVSDTGAGMSAGDLERVFEPFYTKKVMGRTSGTGLGLSVVYGVTKDHNGYIDVASSEGRGSEFTLYFPSSRDSVCGPAEEDRHDLPLGTEPVLVVDDVAQQRKIAARLLKRLGYEPTLAKSGEEAVALMREAAERGGPSPFALIVLDMILEDGFDGLDTYRAISALYPGHKCIIVSGFSESNRALEAEALGAGRFLEKPYTLRELARVVRDEINRPPVEPSEQ